MVAPHTAVQGVGGEGAAAGLEGDGRQVYSFLDPPGVVAVEVVGLDLRYRTK